MKSCVDCKHFTDGHYSKVYISPMCTKRGTDSAAYMRQYVCGIDEATFYEPKTRQTDLGKSTVDISTP